jgi:NTP pyrophosphatase (non-canonical NTP hydrolase)
MNNSQNLTFAALRQANAKRLVNTPKFAKSRHWTRSQWLQALVGEVGELANKMKKADRGDFASVEEQIENEIDIAKELADVQTYLDLLSQHMRIDLAGATINKFNEVSLRVGSDVFL